MNWTNPFKRKPKVEPAPVVTPAITKSVTAAHIIGLEPWSFTNGLSQGGSDAERYENARIEWRGLVFACEDVRATTLALCQLELFRNDERVEKHPLYDLMQHPNGYQSEYELRYNTQMMLDQFGNAFWYVERGNGQKPKALYSVAPQYMKATMTGAELTGWLNETPGEPPKGYRADEIIHFKRPNPYSSVYGASVIMRAAMEIDQDILMKMASLGLLQNKSIPPIVIKASVDSGIGQEGMEQVLDAWNAKYRGTNNTGFAAGVPAGLEVEALTGIDITQLLYLEARDFGRKEICAIFRTPEAMLGYVSDANRANMNALEYIFKTQTIKPLGRMFCDTIEARLLPMFGDSTNLTCELDFEIPRDDVQHLAELTAGFERNWFNADECRAELGYDPKTDGTGEQYFISGMLVPVELAIDPPKPDPALMPQGEPTEEETPATPEDDPDANSEPAKALEGEVSKAVETKTYHPRSLFKTSAARANRALTSDALRGAWVDAYHAKLEKYLNGQKKRVLAAMRESYKGLEISKDAEDLDRIIDEIFANENEKYAEAMRPTVTKLVIAFGSAAVHDLNPAADYHLGKLRQLVAQDLLDRSKLINGTTAKQLRELIQQAIDEGDINASGLGRRISNYFEDISQARANTIARTEVGRAETIAKHDGWAQMGAVAREWIIFPGNRGEEPGNSAGIEAHQLIWYEGAVARMGEPYEIGGLVTMGPRMSGEPSMDCNCRCDEAPITDDEYTPPSAEDMAAYAEEIG